MKRKIKIWLSRWSIRMIVRQRKFWRNAFDKFSPSVPTTENQELAISIVKKAIAHPDVELLMAPITGTRYIRYNEIFISIETCLVTIINGTYSYHVSIPEKETYQLIDKFNFRLEYLRKNWEATIRNKTKRSLTTILAELHRIQ
jgi:hypothetical protein